MIGCGGVPKARSYVTRALNFNSRPTHWGWATMVRYSAGLLSWGTDDTDDVSGCSIVVLFPGNETTQVAEIDCANGVSAGHAPKAPHKSDIS